ncbi:hypothetical protein EDD85DRAFT_852447 [Armillaria nabsnona]|nr:hypothetical protein EDD85DRAFT_852447 [Armillaria nabsnona]
MATNPTPIPIPTHSVPPGIDIGAYRRRTRLLHTTRVYAASWDLTSAVISAWEGAHIDTSDDDQRNDGDDDDVGGCRYTPLRCYGTIYGRDTGEGERGGNTLEGGRHRRGWQDEDRDTGSAPRRRRTHPFRLRRTTRGCNECTQNHGPTTIASPTTVHLGEHQHRRPLHHGSPPAFSYWRIPHYLGGGLRTRRVRGSQRPGRRGSLPHSDPNPFRPISIPTA